MTRERLHTLTIRTPEGIAFAIELAGPVSRGLALAVDAAAVAALSHVASLLFMLVGLLSADLYRAASMAATFAIGIGYGIAMEWGWRGQTFGKRLLRLRVMDAEGLRLRFGQVVVRNLLRAVDQIPLFYGVGGVACLLTRRSQRLGDLAAGTLVVRVPPRRAPDLEQLLAGKYNSLRAHPHVAARLCQLVSPREAGLALRALLRREEFEADARVRLFQAIASLLRARVALPAEAVEGIADEQLVRNAVDILFRTGPAGTAAPVALPAR